jgi:NAD(P)-dependent dehydrogenase (short-subunit alcohol dehydrogenase family)
MERIGFDEQVVVITGAGNGLGRAYALEIAARGGLVVVNDLGCDVRGLGSNQAPADAVVQEIKARGGRAVASCDSVETSSGGRRIIEAAMDHYGRVDALISNAGTLRNASIEELSDEVIDAMIGVHLKGAFNVARPAFAVMRQQRCGRILFASSSAGVFGNPTQAAYGAAKAGIMGLMNVIAIEGKPHGILANALLPAAMTRMASEVDDALLARIAVATLSFGNAGAPEFVAPLAVYLVSKASSATHGMYSAAGGTIARVFVGATRGWHGSVQQAPTVEAVAAGWEQVEDRKIWGEPHEIVEEYELTARHRLI